MELGGGILRLGISSRAMFGVLLAKQISRIVFRTRLMSHICAHTMDVAKPTFCMKVSKGCPITASLHLKRAISPKWHCHCNGTYTTAKQLQPRKVTALPHYVHNFQLWTNKTSSYHQGHFGVSYIKCTPLSSVPWCILSPTIRRFSSQGDDTEIQTMENDPELKMLLREINRDFASNSAKSTSSSSESDVLDSDSVKESTAVMSHTCGSTSDANLNLTSLTDVNLDGTVPEEDDFCDDEFEDFYQDFEGVEEEIPELELPISIQRGVHGVYDVEEVVTLLESEKARDLVVIAVPHEFKYVDHLVIVTGHSTRHLTAMSERLRWVYKRKRGTHDPKTVKIEGQLSKDWMALDLGNIAVHLFLPATRKTYDLETLWTVGADFDMEADEQTDPFALYVDWGVATPNVSTGEQVTDTVSSIPRRQQYEASMDSVTGWHGSQGKS